MTLKPPIVALNFKAYPQVSTLEGCLRLSKIAEEVAKDHGVTIMIAPPFPFLAKVCEEVGIPVFAQHADAVEPGAKTGHVTLEQIKGSGACGFILNHSERRMILADIDWIVKRAKEIGLTSLVCTNTVEVSVAAASLFPDIIAIEPPELIGGDISVTTAKPEIVSGTVEAVRKVNKECLILTGAGVKRKEDLKKALELGTDGVLLASGYVKAKDPKGFLEDLISVL